MSQSLPARAGRLIPWGFLGMLAFVWAIERCAIRDQTAFRNSTGVCWSHTARQLKEAVAGRDILCFGDSMVKYGLNHRTIEARTARSAYNLAVPGGSAPLSYFLLRRALARGSRPSTVVVDFFKDFLRDEPASPRAVYPWAELLDLPESLDLSWTAGDPDLFARITLGRLLPSVRNRFEIRDAIRTALKGEELKQRLVPLVLWRHLNRNDGDMVLAKARFEDSPAPPATARLSGTWRPDPCNVHYLRKFLSLAARHQIRVVWLLPPVSPGAQAADEFTGDAARFDTFVRSELGRCANLDVLDARRSGYEATVFHDVGHLDRDGSLALSEAVAGFLVGRDRGRPGPGRWIALPAYRKPTSELPREDLDQTWVAISTLVKDKVKR